MHRVAMLTAINLDSEVQRRTIEVQHVWIGGMLTAETRSLDLPRPWTRPDLALAVDRPPPQRERLFRAARRVGKALHGGN